MLQVNIYTRISPISDLPIHCLLENTLHFTLSTFPPNPPPSSAAYHSEWHQKPPFAQTRNLGSSPPSMSHIHHPPWPCHSCLFLCYSIYSFSPPPQPPARSRLPSSHLVIATASSLGIQLPSPPSPIHSPPCSQRILPKPVTVSLAKSPPTASCYP